MWRKPQSFGFSWPCAAREFEDRGREVDDVADRVTQFARPGNTGGPASNQRRGNAAFVDPNLMTAERRVGRVRPARSQAEEGCGGTLRRREIVAIAAHRN